MAYTTVPTVTTGDTWTAANHNTYIRDNFAAGLPALVQASGDLFYGNGSQALTRLPIGTYGQVLAVNSAGTGMEWKLPPFMTVCLIYGNKSISYNSYADLDLSEELDPYGLYSSGTINMTSAFAGDYLLLLDMTISCSTAPTSGYADATFLVNGYGRQLSIPYTQFVQNVATILSTNYRKFTSGNISVEIQGDNRLGGPASIIFTTRTYVVRL
jgi:hypothetical protein